jgi:hypothetical protein
MDVSLYTQKPELLQQTAEQLIKDFGSIGIHITFSGNSFSAYAELSGQVQPHIERLLLHEKQKFISLLYRVDLSETQIQKATREQPLSFFPQLITDLILKRELQKVVIRNHYKAK